MTVKLDETGTTIVIEPKLHDGDIFPPGFEDDDWGGKGCEWEHCVCTSMPTHQITTTLDVDTNETETELFCERHYVTTLARFMMMHPVETHCCAPFESHFASYGSIADQLKAND
jgi:hypothetical protein